MGGRHVATVFTEWSTELPDRSMRILAYMANVCRDDVPRPIYWGGREALCEMGLGRRLPTPDRTDEVAERTRRAAFKSLSDTLMSLRRTGAVVLLNRPAPGRNAEYELILRRPPRISVVPETVHGERVVNGVPAPWSAATSVHGGRADQYTVSRTTVHGEPDNGTRSPCTRGETNTTNTTGGITSPLGPNSLVLAAIEQMTGRELALHKSGCNGWIDGTARPCLICKPHLIDKLRVVK